MESSIDYWHQQLPWLDPCGRAVVCKPTSFEFDANSVNAFSLSPRDQPQFIRENQNLRIHQDV